MNRCGPLLILPMMMGVTTGAVAAVQDESCLLFADRKITASDASSQDLFGASVEVSGEWAAVGAPLVDDAATDAGAVYMLQEVTGDFVEFQKLVPTGLGTADWFGASVALHEGVLVAGAPFHDGTGTDSGAAFVYRWDGTQWREEQKLVALNAGDGDEFGHDVAVEGSMILVSAWREHDRGRSGSVRVFEYDGRAWKETQSLRASDGSPGDRFGSSVALDGDALAIGAMRHSGAAFLAGAAYVFRHDCAGWSEEQILVPQGLGGEDQLGEVIDLDGDVVIIGTRYDDDLGTDSGAAYVYRHDGSQWSLEVKLLTNDGVNGDEFGAAVAVFGDSCLVGSRVGNNLGAGFGGAYLFVRDGATWQQQQQVVPQPLLAYGDDNFGWGVALDRDSGLIASRLDDDAAADAGAVQVYRRVCDPCQLRAEVQTIDSPSAKGSFVDLFAAGGEHLLIAPSDSTRRGQAHAYRRQSGQWVYLDTLVPTLATSVTDIDVDGSTAVVGQGNSSVVQVFQFDGVSWRPIQVLRPSDGVPGDDFGRAVRVNGNTLMVGAPEHYTPGIGEGAVYVFDFDGVVWTEVQKLVANSPGITSAFGSSLDLEGTRLVVTTAGPRTRGPVYVFESSGGTWLQTDRIQHPTEAFWAPLSLSGDAFAVTGTRTVFVYRHDGSAWVEESVPLSPVVSGSLSGGHTLALDGSRLLVGHRDSDFFGRRLGAVEGYWFDGSQWRARWLFHPRAWPSPFLKFGHTIETVGDDLLIGDYRDSVRLFRLAPALFAGPSPVQASETLTLLLCDGAAGQVGLIAAIDVSGIPLFLPVLRGLLDANCELTQVMPVPPGLEGLSVQLLGVATDKSTARAALTNVVTVRFE